MPQTPDLHELARRDGRYDVEAFLFVSQGLRHAAKLFSKEQATGNDRHLTAEQLVDGALDLAVERFGLLAGLVLRGWGLRSSQDLGAVTFALIDNQVFTKQSSDRIEDFYGGPDFAAAIAERVSRRIQHKAAKV